MSTIQTKSGRRFDLVYDQIDVTSCHRPNPNWVFVDPQGHKHQWTFVKDGAVIQGYHPSAHADVLSCTWKSVDYWNEDGEWMDIGYRICALCGVRVSPGYTADTVRRYIPGLPYCTIDGYAVSMELFKAELRKEGVDVP